MNFPDASMTFPDASMTFPEPSALLAYITFPDASMTFLGTSMTFSDASESGDQPTNRPTNICLTKVKHLNHNIWMEYFILKYTMTKELKTFKNNFE